ncbi:DMT family transporter [Dyadobacter pollutisoli]|jgi:transporter family-2 protein|uniref:DMT family transporter n=1 Tax=Dyadobacter pollutisoli TaxID=2910158 RepID=A0A9E8SJV5_9BACT|nr:DMT family transporter [Dyadobacter pollutisoli]WAC11268.1 DMT family transporter [Dyadobacter pollutisoli]
MNWLFLFLAFLIGISNAVQSGVNTQLRESINNPILAAMTSFFVGLVILSIAFACFNQNPIPTLNDFRQVSWTRFMGGVLGAFYVITVIFIVRDIGPANMICLVVAGQMIAAMTIDHYGFQGFAVHQITLPRMAGAVLLVAGVYLILKN